MAGIYAKTVLLPAGWQHDVRLDVVAGTIVGIEAGVAPRAGDEHHEVIVPGLPNLHSHAFQRAMAGLAERRGLEADSFWSWRERMYGLALAMTPTQAEAVAAQLYMEMLESGFTRVGEFHYLHHDRDGRPYADIGEMANRIASAAGQTGIRLTLLPVFYAHGGFGGLPPMPQQRRFISDVEGFERLVSACRAATSALPGSVVGVAPHSLRAVTPDELGAVTGLAGDGPVHIHVAEQVLEVTDCLAWSGARPAEWLLDHADVGPRWCLIHATHMTEAETRSLAASGATVGLCPITEANLGDGTFPALAFRAAGGRFGVGSDSNILIGLGDELRQLEYSQRLLHRARNVLARPGGSTGRALFEGALAGGAAALGGVERGLFSGGPADFVSLDVSNAPYLHEESVLDGWIFGRLVVVDCVWVGGEKRVAEGRHVARERIADRFGTAMRDLIAEA